mmetsp:Transcript_8002/g.23009  ORF Transcript_8002/g.23009 Transcript_8002/m.23009 type:complete len:273 (+) Transcript_8002:163-981(+)
MRLHDNSDSVLEAGHIGSLDSSGCGECDLWCDFLDEGCGNVSASVLGLEGSEWGLVACADSRDVADLVAGVTSGGGEGEVAVDLVQESEVDGGELARACDGGEHRAVGVADAGVECGESGLSGEAVRGISSDLHTVGKADAGTAVDAGHFEHVHGTGGADVSVGVVNSKDGSLVGLEGDLDSWHDLHGGFEDASAAGGELGLVNIELGLAELGSDLGAEGAVRTSFGFDGDSDWSGILLAFQGGLGRVIIEQKVLWCLGDICEFGGHFGSAL